MKEYIVQAFDFQETIVLDPFRAEDVPELIRCQDCKYNDDGECIIKAGWFPVKPDWFCADGER